MRTPSATRSATLQPLCQAGLKLGELSISDLRFWTSTLEQPERDGNDGRYAGQELGKSLQTGQQLLTIVNHLEFLEWSENTQFGGESSFLLMLSFSFIMLLQVLDTNSIGFYLGKPQLSNWENSHLWPQTPENISCTWKYPAQFMDVFSYLNFHQIASAHHQKHHPGQMTSCILPWSMAIARKKVPWPGHNPWIKKNLWSLWEHLGESNKKSGITSIPV